MAFRDAAWMIVFSVLWMGCTLYLLFKTENVPVQIAFIGLSCMLVAGVEILRYDIRGVEQ